MKLNYLIVYAVAIVLSQCLYIKYIIAASILHTVSITNNVNQAAVTMRCDVIPVYVIFALHNPERIVIDFLEISQMQQNVSPINFNDTNLIKCVRTSISESNKRIRIVLDLTCTASIASITQKEIKKNYCIILILLKVRESNVSYTAIKPTLSIQNKKVGNGITRRIFNNQSNKIANNRNNNQYTSKKENSTLLSDPIVVAIDAGHGGQDPGATGYNGIYEKNITINIAKKLKMFLDSDPAFTAVMIRDGDYFLPVMERSDLARKKGANILVSIHADSALNANVRGASVWVLSNRRAKKEAMHWLQQRKEKHLELLGGLGDILTSAYSDPYFNHLVLDLQFGYAQRVGYNIAAHILQKLKNVNILHKNIPEYSNFGVLRSPDIPSVLVETGFISNRVEACLLSNHGYQEKIAKALYHGLCSYFAIKPQKQLLLIKS